MTKAKFLGVVFDRTLFKKKKNHVGYLKTNGLNAPDILKVAGHTDWGGIGKLYSAFIDP